MVRGNIRPPMVCHCEACFVSRGNLAFASPNSFVIARPHRDRSNLSFVVPKYRRLLRRSKRRSSPQRHCGEGRSLRNMWGTSALSLPRYRKAFFSLVIASLRKQAWQSLFCGSQVPEIASSPKIRTPRNDIGG